MKTPKVLPWLARKAGLTNEYVELLWSSAFHHASLRQPQLAANQRMAVAMQALVARLGREKNRDHNIRSSVRASVNDAGRPAAAPELLQA